MAEEDEPKLVQLPCIQCGKTAVAGIPVRGGEGYNLCFEHLQQHEAMRLRQIETYAAMADRLEDQLDDTWGLPRRARPQPAPRVNVHQIHIHGDNLGVVNTGTVQNIENNVTAINQSDPALAANLQQLAEGILRSAELTDDEKRDAAELLREVTSGEKRPRVVLQSIATGLGHVLTRAAQLATLWKAIEPQLLQ